MVAAPLRSITGAERQLHQVFYRHNLLDLAHAAHVELTGEQSETAAILSQFIVWRGRYVLPLERGIDELLPIKHHDGLVGPPDRDVTIDAAKSLLDHVIANVKAGLYGGA